ncbi:MAG TPA: PQQ-dependent sugar dehydrogenase [Patescibacteria group bacterium]|jgi:glucose/arabinose dehydrogenase|nr:PQQ-dependent sugar dehydrogenase [Patescibacteria group bacterium]
MRAGVFSTNGRRRSPALTALALSALVAAGGPLLPPLATGSVAAAQPPSAGQPASVQCQAGFMARTAQAAEPSCSRTAQVATAGAVPAGFHETVVWSNLVNPTAIRFAGDGRVFVAEKSGTIKVFDNLADQTPTMFGGLTTNVMNFWDRGLLGIALDPSLVAGSATGFLYVLYTYDHILGSGSAPPRWGDSCPAPPGATTDGCVVSGRLSRFAVNGTTIGPSEQVLLEDWCNQFPSHSIGTVMFGPGGALYVSGGDGANFNNADWGQFGGTTSPVVTPVNPCNDPPGGAMAPPSAEGGALRSQDMRTTGDSTGLDGAILRIDPATGAGLPGNPFAGSADANARRIIAYGLRNPFRITTRPGTNELWVGDVGWSTWEEINRIPNATDNVAENFGWPCYEHNEQPPSYRDADLTICEDLYASAGAETDAYYSYNHGAKVVATDTCPTANGSSITGLAFYPESGGTFPAAFNGALFFADYSRNCIWYMPKGSNGQPDVAARQPFVQAAAAPVDVVIGPNGDLFYVDLVGGTIRRVSWISGNQPPTADINATPTSGSAPLHVNFSGTGSSDPEGLALTYAWDLDGDGQYDDATGATTSRTYSTPGNVTVGLRVTDIDGASDTTTQLISAGNDPPVPSISTPTVSMHWKVNDVIPFSGSASDPQDGALPASALSWTLDLLHCPSSCHTHQLNAWPGVASGSFAAPDHEYPSHLLLTLTATDSNGLSASRSVQLDPMTVTLTLQSAPAGLQLVMNDQSATTPSLRTVIVGSSNVVTAPALQTLGGNGYRFQSWSDAGAASHTIVAPASPATWTASYARTSFRISPVADAFVKASAPRTNYGKSTSLRARKSEARSYLKFTVSGLTAPATDVRLRLWVTNPSGAGVDVYRANTNAWSETGVTWKSMPPLGAKLASTGKAVLGTWLEIDLGTAITANGTYTLVVCGRGSNAAWFTSRESTHDPQLVVFR